MATPKEILEEKELGRKIKEEVKSWNIADENDLTYAACVVFFFMARTGISSRYIIAHRLRYRAWPGEWKINRFILNWFKAGRYSFCENKFTFDFSEDNELANKIELTLFSMLGAGKVICIEAEEDDIIE